MRYFLDVAETQHVTKSAQRLHIAQPALSRSIHHLEDELGCTLFTREGRNIRLTEEGACVRTHIRAAIAELDAARAEVADLTRTEQQTVRVEVRAGSYVTMDALSGWMGAHPESRIKLVQSNGDDTLHPDIVVECPVEGESPQIGLESQSFSERILVAVPDQAGGNDAPVTFAELEKASFVSLSASSGFRRVCDQLCARNGFAPSIGFESDNPAAVRKAISLGLGVGFWPEWSWGTVSGDGICVKAVAAGRFERTIAVTCLSERGRAFFTYLCDAFAQRRKARPMNRSGFNGKTHDLPVQSKEENQLQE